MTEGLTHAHHQKDRAAVPGRVLKVSATRIYLNDYTGNKRSNDGGGRIKGTQQHKNVHQNKEQAQKTTAAVCPGKKAALQSACRQR